MKKRHSTTDGNELQHFWEIFTTHRKWYILSIAAALLTGLLYLHHTTPIYQLSTKVMIKDIEKSGHVGEMAALTDLGIFNTTGSVENEIELLRSQSLIRQVVESLDLNTTYTRRSFYKKEELYDHTPLLASLLTKDKEHPFRQNYRLTVIYGPDSLYHIECQARDEQQPDTELTLTADTLPCSFQVPEGRIILSRNEEIPLKNGDRLYIDIRPTSQSVKSYFNNLEIRPTSRTASIVIITLKESNIQRGEDFLNKLIELYNEDANIDKNLTARRTEKFINERIAIVGNNLEHTEGRLQDYKVESGLVNLVSNAEKTLKEGADYEKKLVEISMQLNLVQSLAGYIFDPKNELKLLPPSETLSDASLIQLINAYNNQIIERERLLINASEENPTVISLTATAHSLLENIKRTVENLKKELTISKNNIEREVGKYAGRISNAPIQERMITGLSRQQTMEAELYLMLLQKREANSIALAATSDKAKIIDQAQANENPISPRKSWVLIMALGIGILLPTGIFYLKELLKYRIGGRNDVEKLSQINILGEIPHVDSRQTDGQEIVVHKNNNDIMAETFRSIRTNLNFLLPNPGKRIILFTSTQAGEGKTFVSANLAISTALLGKKVLLCGLDIRKPRLLDVFGLPNTDKGITIFLAEDPNNKQLLMEQIIPSGVHENLALLPAGIIPPNPTELLAKENLDKAFDFLNEEYDYIFVDSAPIGLVTDTLLVGRIATASVYVCRANYTQKNDFTYINELYADKKLPNMSLLINDINLKEKRRNGNRYHLYGYGYENKRN